jgi:uncharacterized protein (TIGR00251 family)
MAQEVKARISVRVHPNARRSGFAGMIGEHHKLNVMAPPIDGRANEACIDFLAGFFGVRRGAVRVVTGQTSRTKLFEVEGISPEELRLKLDSIP